MNLAKRRTSAGLGKEQRNMDAEAASNSNTVLFETIVCLVVTWPVFVRHVVRSTGSYISFVIQIRNHENSL